MAATVELPAVGKVDQRWVIAGGALVAGLVGYAWWTRSGETGTEGEIIGYDSEGNAIYAGGEGAYDALGFPLQPGSTPDYRPPTIVDSNYTGEAPDAIDTNAEWTQAAINVLTSYGASPVAVSSALGKYLDRRPLNSVEMDLVRQAIAAAGPPPVGGPYQLIEEQAGAATGPPDVTGLRASGTTISWNNATGAAGWEIRRDGYATPTRVSSPTYQAKPPGPGTWTYRVRAFNTANQFGPEAVVQVRTTGSTGGGTLPAPSGVIAVGGDDGYFRVGWIPVAGATGYRIRREGSGAPNTWATVGPSTPYWASHVRGLRRPTRFAFRVQTLGPGGAFGGNRVSNSVTVRP